MRVLVVVVVVAKGAEEANGEERWVKGRDERER